MVVSPIAIDALVKHGGVLPPGGRAASGLAVF